MPTDTIPHMQKWRIYLVDEHPIVRDHLTHVLGRRDDMTICGESDSTAAAMASIQTCTPHAVVTELFLNDGSGLEMIQNIKVLLPKICILVLTAQEETHYAHRALQAGAMGYVTKKEPTRRIVEALRSVLEGNIHVSAAYAQQFMNRFGRGARTDPIASLSDREIEIFSLIGRGYGTRRIASALHLSAKTVEEYRSRIKSKLRLHDANELLCEAMHFVEHQPAQLRKSPLPLVATAPSPDNPPRVLPS